ncbi:RagB/SusD family nutrient uptake outer membrane protein [Neotamlana laminarinivorans]|uniref:RagB/SusD family nutrient uptake outer membrane protein n=1 Tax=Neotamlana laminarinivorans TaxID=2883124 RepID=A0A9X1HY47_9FLAO|nr:RagB/SusD family nutrient uptake outer membrane protein [Tamlana laminarinivorans]MCB4798274.1 RagB/SusD family nutrient uptake outer membrane protein [Tamlana laminarinivorans]
MKNIKYIGLILILTSFVGCSEVIEFDPHDEYAVTEADYLQTQEDYETMAVSCYTPMQWLNQLYVIADIASDNAVAGGENASDVISLQHLDDLSQLVPNNSTLSDLYLSAYEGINRTNYLLSYKDQNLQGETITWSSKEAMYGEVYFLRAYYYFALVKMFGNTVLFTDKKLGVSDFGTLQRSPKEEVYTQIETDLLDAISALPTTQDQEGRITKYAAQALLGKVYIYQEKFDEAIPVLNEVVNGPFTLVDTFDDIFLLEGENGLESVLEVQYSNGQPYYNWGGQTRGQGNYAVQQCGIRSLSAESSEMPYNSGWSTNLPTQDLALAYEDGDQRKDATCFDIEAYIAANPTWGITYQEAPYNNTGLYNKKYLPRAGQTSGQVELNYENNHRIIRYAEVLLLAAEANLRGSGSATDAQTYLDMVRDRAFGDTNHRVTATVDVIWNERRLELAMEGDRFFDLVRTGQAAGVIDNFVTGKHEVFPIPQDEIDISGIEQNPGY